MQKRIQLWPLVAILVLINTNGYGQRDQFIRHNQLVDSAKTLLVKGDTAGALDRFERGIAIIPWNTYDYYPAIIAAVSAQRTELALQLLMQACSYGLCIEFEDNEIIDRFLITQQAKPYLEQKAALYTTYQTTVDTALIAEVMELFEKDIAVRTPSFPLGEMAEQDSIHFDQMIAICKRYDTYPTRLLGATAGYWFLPLWHHSGADQYPHSRQWKEILPFIQAAIARGDLDPAYLCSFDDIEDIDLKHPLRWGNNLDFGKENDLPQLLPRAQLNANRATVGWGTIEDYALQEGWDLDKMVKDQ